MTSALPLMATFTELQQQQPAASAEAVAVRRRVTSSSSLSAAAAVAASETGRKAVEDDVVSAAEISKHSSETDAWVVVDGVVYDITKFLATHPGGAQVIVEQLQTKDLGEVMRGDESGSHAHSQYAFRMLQQFRIGRVRDDDGSNPGGLQSSNACKENKYTVDLNKPLVFQVGHLGADYDQWVHDPIVQKEPPRFFESDVAEFFTKTAWWVIPAVWGPLVVYLTGASVKEGLWLSAALVCMAVGAFIWTFIEYLLHRFVFHMKTSRYWTNTLHYFLHGFHHKHPMDGTRLVFPPAITGIIVSMIWFITEPLCLIVGRPSKMSIFSGGLLMYIIYDLTHYFLHFGTPFSKMSSKLKRFHLNHHFRDQTNSYGVTTPFWDTIFETFPGNPIKHY